MGVAKQVTALEKKKSFLGEFCASVVCQLLDQCPEEVCSDGLLYELGVASGWEGCTAERLVVILHLNKLYGKVCARGVVCRVGVVEM